MKISTLPVSPIKKNIDLKSTNTAISLKPYLQHIEDLLKKEKTIKAAFYQFILNNISKHSNLEEALKSDKIEQYEEVLEFVYATLSYDLLGNTSDNLWAFSKPFLPEIFYSTAGLKNIMNAEINTILRESISEIQETRLVYAFILNKMYGYEAAENDIYYSFIDELSGQQKYYLIDFDFRFVDVNTEGVLPKLDSETLYKYMHPDSDLSELKDVLPLKKFKFEGFSILRFHDLGTQHLVTNIENIISNRENQAPHLIYEDIIRCLKIVIPKTDIEIGFLPFLKINNQIVLDDKMPNHSILASVLPKNDVQKGTINEDLGKYFKTAKPLIFPEITEIDEKKYPFLSHILLKEKESVVLIPVFLYKKLLGVIELYAPKKGIISKADIGLMNLILPQIGQLFQNNINDYESNIESVIKQNFTSLHPSVQWKFNETAWLFLKENSAENAAMELRKIKFNNVYPLYGAIDIRNSTHERNISLQKDMLKQLALLQETLESISKKVKLELLNEMLFECKKWTKLVEGFINSSEENGLNNFLMFEIEPLLQHLKINFPETQKSIDSYFEAIDETRGVTFEHRRKLEKSITLINKVINTQLESMVKDLQLSYPFYFEKFRTDGVEYDIYIGQSIAPDRPFDMLYLTNARLWQLKSMAAIVKSSELLSPQLPTFLQTTNLIFAHTNAIDISFRNDERRFDVEGAYNIRYQMIKKRIDKVNIKETEERLTQPGKIAIVYFNQKEADEYIKFIQSLIEQEVFTDSLECVELEDLQGVVGLKALRITVKLA